MYSVTSNDSTCDTLTQQKAIGNYEGEWRMGRKKDWGKTFWGKEGSK